MVAPTGRDQVAVDTGSRRIIPLKLSNAANREMSNPSGDDDGDDLMYRCYEMKHSSNGSHSFPRQGLMIIRTHSWR